MDIRSFVTRWNNLFPIDLWYRRRYNIPFNSEKHREVCQIDVYFEWIEYRLLEQKPLLEVSLERVREENEKLIPDNKYLIPQKQEEELVKEELDLFDKIDIDSLNKSLNGH